MNMSAMSLARNFYNSFQVSQKSNLLGGLPSTDFSSVTGSRTQSMNDLQALAKQFESFNANKSKIRDHYKELVKKTDFDVKDFFSNGANSISSSAKVEAGKSTAKADPALEAVSKNAANLKAATDAFLKTDNAALTKPDSTGKVNMDKVKSALDSYISAYNGTVTAVAKSGNSNVMAKGISMMNLSAVNKEKLSEIGITSDKSGKLKLNEETFKKSDLKALKQVFEGKYGYMNRVHRAAENITNVVQGAKQKTYNNVGNSSFSMANTLGVGNFVNFTA